MLAGVFFALTAVMPIVNFMVNIVVSRGGNETHLGLALFLMGASELPAALLFPHLRRRLGSRGTLVLSIVFMAIKPLLFWADPIPWMGPGSTACSDAGIWLVHARIRLLHQ